MLIPKCVLAAVAAITLLSGAAGDQPIAFEMISPLTAQTTGDGEALSAGPALVPEPSTWAFMVLGFMSVGLMLRRARPRTPVTEGRV
jgi:hypothetical protein